MTNKRLKRINYSKRNKGTVLLVVFLIMAVVCVFSFNRISYASWVEEEDGIRYIQEDGQYAVGFVDIEDKRYYFDVDGHLVYGKFYVEEEECYYYSNAEGVVQVGAIQTENDFYITDHTGRLLTGFAEYDGQRYYFNQIAQLVVGWFKHEDNWYYANSVGKIMTGFVTVDGYRYYFNPDGTRVQNCILEIDGITYSFNADGTIDENTTVLYPVFQQINNLRRECGLSELVINQKVQACAILQAANLVNGFSSASSISTEQILLNRGVQTKVGYEFAYGGIVDYNITRLLSDMQKDVNFMNVLYNESITDVGLGMFQEDNVFYYDIIFITNER